MANTYYETIDAMEKKKVDPEYVNGWACGYLRTPKREEQRLTEAYQTGYRDGMDRKTDNFATWIRK